MRDNEEMGAKARQAARGRPAEGADPGQVAAQMMAALDAGAQVSPVSFRHPTFGLDDAYHVAALVRRAREARGERVIGRKIGFTNRTIWDEYGVHAPIWGYVYEQTMRPLGEGESAIPLSRLAEPRIEPEIVFGLAAAPRPDMDEAALLGCIGWVAHGFEIVQSIFPGWRFAAADTVAAFGLHGVLLAGPRRPVIASARAEWLRALADFDIDLLRNGVLVDRGRAANVLGGPLSALKHCVTLLAVDAHNPPLAAGEIVTTGTLTRAMPVAAGEAWSTRLSGIPLEGIAVELV